MMVPGQSWQCSVSEEAQPPQPAFADSNGKAKAISALVNGVFALAGEANALAEGVSALAKGANALAGEASASNERASALADGTNALADVAFALAGVASAKAKMTFAEAFVAASPAASTRLWLALWLASPILRGCTATVFHSPSSL